MAFVSWTEAGSCPKVAGSCPKVAGCCPKRTEVQTEYSMNFFGLYIYLKLPEEEEKYLISPKMGKFENAPFAK